jgi:hypothetical protein
MRIVIAAATVLVSAAALLAPSIGSAASGRDVENGISELSARGGGAYRGARGFRGPRVDGVGVRAGTTGVGVRARIPGTTGITKPLTGVTTPR